MQSSTQLRCCGTALHDMINLKVLKGYSQPSINESLVSSDGSLLVLQDLKYGDCVYSRLEPDSRAV
jgi:hypothetical protein